MTTIIIWIILMIFIIIKGEGADFSMWVASLIFAFLISVAIHSGSTSLNAKRKVDTGMGSCWKCGYVGANRGICPNCGRALQKIYKEEDL